MKLTARLAYSQLKVNKKRTLWTLLGIVLTTAMITAVYGLVASSSDFVNTIVGTAYTMREQYEIMLAGLGTILSGFIVISSVIVLSNAFRVSAKERIHQFGILKSVGATKKQINQTVIYESLILALLGVPVGVLVGLVIQMIGVGLINHFLADIFAYGWNEAFGVRFVFSWLALFLSVALAMITVFLSAWFPAIKASKIPAIDAIRGAGEVKVNHKKIKSSWLVGKIFGFEGVLAAKSLKRNKRNFRATVVALSLSVALIITLGGFVSQMNSLMDLTWHNVEATASVNFSVTSQLIVGEDGVETWVQDDPMSKEKVDYLSNRFKAYTGGEVFGIGHQDMWPGTLTLSRDELTPQMIEWIDTILGREWQDEIEWGIGLATIDSENYAILAESIGLPPDSNILINLARSHTEDGRRWEFEPLHFTGQTLQVEFEEGEPVKEIPLHGQLGIGQVPPEMMNASPHAIVILVPELDPMRYIWFVNAPDPASFLDYAYHLTREMGLRPEEGDNVWDGWWFANLQQDQEWTRALVNLVLVFMWGFVALLTLIYLTNIISTISTNVQLRSQEFAMLRSVGMTKGGLNRVLSLESTLSSIKALLIGIPLGIGGAYLVYNAIISAAQFPFRLPFEAIGLCILGVFILIWIVTRYSARRLQKRNIVETIRGESGM